jgi:hypothetical protein
VSQLLPDGVDGLADCPYTLHDAILGALRILGYEEFPIEERPPRHMWLDAEALVKWWDEVSHARKQKFGLPDDQDDNDDDYDENPLAGELISRGSR